MAAAATSAANQATAKKEADDELTRRAERREEVSSVLKTLSQTCRDFTRDVTKASRTLIKVLRDSERSIEKERKRAERNERQGYRKRKDPQRPKRPPSSYLLFCQDHRAGVVQQLGADASPTEITKTLGTMWQELTQAEKEPYIQKYQEMLSDFRLRSKSYDESKAGELRMGGGGGAGAGDKRSAHQDTDELHQALQQSGDDKAGKKKKKHKKHKKHHDRE